MNKLTMYNRLYSQYKDKPKIKSLIKIYQDIFNDLQVQNNYVINSYNVNTADTNQLDFIGSLVQIQRPSADNELYRILLKAKIIKNNKNATIEDTLKGLSFIFNKTSVALVDNQNMSFNIEFYYKLSDLETQVLRNYSEFIIQTPQGVKFLGYREIIGITVCGNELASCGYITSQCGIGTII